MLTWAAELRLNFISTQVARHKRVWKILKKISACWIWFGGCITIFGDWDRHNQIVYSISYLIKAFTESKVRNVLDLFWIRDGIIIVKLRTLLDEIYFYYHKSISCSDNNSTPQEWYQFKCTCAMCNKMVKLSLRGSRNTYLIYEDWSIGKSLVQMLYPFEYHLI